MIVSRRSVLAGAGIVLIPSRARAQERADAALRSLLDAAAPGGDAAFFAERLAVLDPRPLSPSARIDRDTALSGLRIDAELARSHPDPAGPMSRDRYRLILRRLTSDDADPGMLRTRIAREHRALLARADRVMRRLGHRSGTVGARYSALWRNPAWLYADDDAGRDRAVADMNATLAVARAAATHVYPDVPTYCFDVAIRRLNKADELAKRGGYRDLPDATRSGGYTVDLREIRRRPSWTLPSVVRHETLPGHMIQLPVEARAAPHPLRLRYAPGFAEGWAIHAERSALDQGVYAADPMAELGCLHWLLFRTGRALIDFDLHLAGWSRSQAHAQLAAWQGEPAYFAPFDNDIDRIVAEPAARVAEAAAWFALDDMQRARGRKPIMPPPYGRVRNDRLKSG